MPTENALAELMIADVLTRWPETAAVFQRRNMACVGCAVAEYYTIRDAANVYAIKLDVFLADLRSAIAASAGGVT